MKWIRLFTDALGDPALQKAARHGARDLELFPWLLAFAARADDDGRLTVNGEPADATDIAHDLPGVKAARVARAMVELEQIQILTRDADGTYRFEDWKARYAIKPSERPEASRERKRLSRARKAAQSSVGLVTPSHAGQDPTVTTEMQTESTETEIERGEAAEQTDTRASLRALPLVSEGALPASAVELLRHVPGDKRNEVEREMRAVLNGGHRFKTALVRADFARLEAKCGAVLVAHAKNPIRNVWVYCLAKLADTSDIVVQRFTGPVPSARAARAAEDAERDAQRGADREYVEKEAFAERWAAEHEDEARALRDTLKRQFPGVSAFATIAIEAAFVSKVWSDYGGKRSASPSPDAER